MTDAISDSLDRAAQIAVAAKRLHDLHVDTAARLAAYEKLPWGDIERMLGQYMNIADMRLWLVERDRARALLDAIKEVRG